MRKIDILLATLVAFVWGGSYISIKYTVMEIPGLLSIAIRYLMVSLVLLPFVERPTRLNFKDIYAAALVMGVFCLGLLYYGTSLGLDTNLTVIVMQLATPISVIIARFSLKEKLTLQAVIGMALAFIGMLVVVGSPSFRGNYTALIFVLFAAFFFAVYYVQSKKLKSLSPLSLLCWTNLIATPHLFIISYFLEGNPFELMQGVTYKLWVSLFYSVTIVSIVGMGVWVYLLRKYSVHKVAPFNLLVPFFGILLSGIFLGEVISWYIIVGVTVTVVGIALSQITFSSFLKNKEV